MVSREIDFDLAGIAEPTLADGDSSTHAPTAAREALGAAADVARVQDHDLAILTPLFSFKFKFALHAMAKSQR